MALSLRSPCAAFADSDHSRSPMDAAEAHCCARRHGRLLLRHRASWLLRSVGFLSPYMCHNIPIGNMFRFSICIGNRDSYRRCAIASMEKDTSTATFSGTRKLVWTVKTDLEAGQLLYVTGDPAALGCWEPEMAILMSPTEHANLWKAEVKIGRGECFKYNYFIKEEASACDIIWRSGPEFSLSVPLTKGPKCIVVRDSWVRSTTSKLAHAQSLMSLFEDAYSHIQTIIPEIDIEDDKSSKQLKSDLMESKLSSDHLTVDEEYSKNDVLTVTHEPISDRLTSERYMPVEEPWLLQSPLLSFVVESSEINEPMHEETTMLDNSDIIEPTQEPSHEGSKLILQHSLSTTILINSSVCTMQRIAVLEDSQLVELLLEPVKTNVQCDSVYIGVITKLVPHMGGAFVNIGGSRPSLMDIKQNREPFIYPPFRHITEKPEVNGSIVEGIEDHLASYGNTELAVHDDDEENDTEDELDVSEILADNAKIGIVGNLEVEADDEDNMDNEHQLGEETLTISCADINFTGDFQIPNLQDMKDSGHKKKWAQVQKGTKVIVQVVKEGLGTKGPTLTAYPKLRSRFWVMSTRCDRIGVSKKILGLERTRLKVIAKTLQPPGFGLTVRTVAAGRTLEELQKDLEGVLSTWKSIMEQAKSASLAADESVEGAVPVILHSAMGQTLSVVQDYFNEKVKKMVVDSARTYHEVTSYLQDIAPDLCDRVELFKKRIPLFDEYNIEEVINSIISKRVPLVNGGSLIIEQTEALVSIDVNGGHVMFGQGNSQEEAILVVNLAAAKQIARELRLRDIGGIIVVDFIDMTDESNKRLVYEEVKKAVERDRSMVKVSELSKHGLMEITRKRVRPSVTFMISEPCSCCHATGRVEALETSFSKIEQEISRSLASVHDKSVPQSPKSWPKFILRVDHHMCEYLTSGKRTRLAQLSSSLRVWILLKVARGFTRGTFEVKPFTENESENQRQATIPVLRPSEAKKTTSGRNVTLIPVKKWRTGRK